VSPGADALTYVLLLGSALLCVAAGVGLRRFPDLLSRVHAATKPQALGVPLALIAVAIQLWRLADVPTLLLAAVFQCATAPLAGHLIGRAAGRDRPLDRRPNPDPGP
jgi:multicomponent Na+:H+ antiporter subunit G